MSPLLERWLIWSVETASVESVQNSVILTDSLYVFDHKAVNMYSIVDPAETAESFLLICLFWSDIGSCVVSLARWCFVATRIVIVVCGVDG